MKQVMVLGLRQIMRENIALSYLKATNLPLDCVFFRRVFIWCLDHFCSKGYLWAEMARLWNWHLTSYEWPYLSEKTLSMKNQYSSIICFQFECNKIICLQFKWNRIILKTRSIFHCLTLHSCTSRQKVQAHLDLSPFKWIGPQWHSQYFTNVIWNPEMQKVADAADISVLFFLSWC